MMPMNIMIMMAEMLSPAVFIPVVKIDVLTINYCFE